jgi:hypothetical protein
VKGKIMAINLQIYERLKEVASNGDLITYGEIAPLANLNMDDPDDRNKMSEILGDISRYEHKQGRPMLSAVVVLAGISYPGEGFFNLARELGLHHGKKELEDLDFFVQEVKRVHESWKRQHD